MSVLSAASGRLRRGRRAAARDYYADRYGPHRDKLSVDFRENEARIRSGSAPEKYARLSAICPGSRVLEIGAGEGVLSLHLAAERGLHVTSMDLTPARHEQAKELQALWAEQGRDVSSVRFVLGDVFDHLELLDEVDTVVAARVIYYFRERLDPLFDLLAQKVRYVVLVGNQVRNDRLLRDGSPGELGEYARYSTPQGMVDLLERHGYRITHRVEHGGDPIVIGEQTGR